MSKFIYINDFHIRGKTPINRIDNYCQTMLTKLKEIMKLAKKNKVDFIIDGGDFYNSPFIANNILDDILDIIEIYKIQWHMLYGNHPLIGHNINNSQSSIMTHAFRRSKYIHHLEEIEENGIYIKGWDYYHNIELDLKELNHKPNKATLNIAVVHAMLMNRKVPSFMLGLNIKDIKTNYDVVLCAHNHLPWGIKEINGTKFINIGCIGRMKSDEADIQPSVLFVDTCKEVYTIIPLTSAKPKEEIFDLEKIAEKKELDESLKKFVESLGDIKLQSINIKDRIVLIGKEKNIEKSVIDSIVERIGGLE